METGAALAEIRFTDPHAALDDPDAVATQPGTLREAVAGDQVAAPADRLLAAGMFGLLLEVGDFLEMPTGPSDGDSMEEYAADPDHWVGVRTAESISASPNAGNSEEPGNARPS